MNTRARGGATTGWAVFAGIVLALVGASNIVYGLVALFEDEVLTVSQGGLIVWDFTAWGWIHLLVGAFMVATALGLFAAAGWARWTAVVLAGVNAVAQVGFITSYPLWTLLIVALDVLVIYHLTARWEQPGTAFVPSAAPVGARSARDEMTRMGAGLDD